MKKRDVESNSNKRIDLQLEFNENIDDSFKGAFQQNLINRMMIVWGIISLLAAVLIVIRIINFEYSVAEIIILFTNISFFMIAVFHNQLSNRIKIFSLITINTILGIVGLYIFGAPAASIFYLSISVTIMSLYSSKRGSIILIIILTLLITLIAFGFISNQIKPLINYDTQCRSLIYWIIYITGIISTLIISAVIIFNYRQSLWKLFSEVSTQRDELEVRNRELQASKNEIKVLRDLLPICAHCKKIRDEKGYWKQIEEYIEKHTDTQFSHSLCEECLEELYGNETWFKEREEKK